MRLVAIGAGAIVLVLGMHAIEQRPVFGQDDVVVMSPVKPDAGGQTQILNGTKQDAANWPATLKFFHSIHSISFSCTATIIGERVVITAAHCVDENARARVDLATGGANLTCNQHPYYDEETLGADVALCLADAIIPLPSTARAEQLNLNLTTVRLESKVFLLGFGCRVDNDSTTSGVLYGGSATVKEMAANDRDHFKTDGGARICPGDSGGAAYNLTDLSAITGRREIVGINSGYYVGNPIRSLNTSLALPLIANFMRDWADNHNVRICGMHQDAAKCRF